MFARRIMSCSRQSSQCHCSTDCWKVSQRPVNRPRGGEIYSPWVSWGKGCMVIFHAAKSQPTNRDPQNTVKSRLIEARGRNQVNIKHSGAGVVATQVPGFWVRSWPRVLSVQERSHSPCLNVAFFQELQVQELQVPPTLQRHVSHLIGTANCPCS